ncbi:MAG TPA: phosphoribosylanthranilate isomerase, partial [Terriglobales bacterium]|nr:phosphoribosylanthranilate isomerase [Terriglobales bacterium]
MRTLVKICGLTRPADARAAVEAGADWLGFVLLGDSPRRIDAAAAAEITAACPGVTTVAVLVAPTPEQALALAARAGARRVQLHRVEAAGWPADFPLPVAFSQPVGADGTIPAALPDERHLILLDTADPDRAGGTGRVFPWEAAASLAARRAVLLAGGLDGDNVAAAIERVRPFGVDASSRLESAPGLKDPRKVRRFVAAVRRCDARLRAAEGEER